MKDILSDPMTEYATFDNEELFDGDGFDVEETMMREVRVVADKGQAPMRLDKFLIDHLANTSRSKI